MRIFTTVIFLLIFTLGLSQSKYKSILNEIDENQKSYAAIAQQIWSFAEMGYQEEQSSALLQKTLQEEGFQLETAVAEIPVNDVTAFTPLAPVAAEEPSATADVVETMLPDKVNV